MYRDVVQYSTNNSRIGIERGKNMSHRVFIGWSGEENQRLAVMLSQRLKKKNYSPVVGGEWRQSFTISTDIIAQMKGCDFGIFLIEKEVRQKNDQVVSVGFNPNVMMELGYMLSKLKDHNRVCRVLLNIDSGELPSDLLGMWSFMVDKKTSKEKTPEENQQILVTAADKVAEDFLAYMENYRNTNKLDYFDNWEENSRFILDYTGEVRISEKLIYGMQAAIYQDGYEELLEALNGIRRKIAGKDYFGDLSAVRCAIALLNVFVVSKRLTASIDQEVFDECCEALEEAYEDNIVDPSLKAWCKIFRIDKLELCYELYAAGLESQAQKLKYLTRARKLCDDILALIREHTDAVIDPQNGIDMYEKKDEMYALLYTAFANRNISQIHKQLATLDPENETIHKAAEKEFCAKTLKNRIALYKYYKENARDNTLAFEYITQEYLLALSEQCKFDEDEDIKERNIRTVRRIYNEWKKHNGIRNMIFDKVTEELKHLPEV